MTITQKEREKLLHLELSETAIKGGTLPTIYGIKWRQLKAKYDAKEISWHVFIDLFESFIEERETELYKRFQEG